MIRGHLVQQDPCPESRRRRYNGLTMTGYFLRAITLLMLILFCSGFNCSEEPEGAGVPPWPFDGGPPDMVGHEVGPDQAAQEAGPSTDLLVIVDAALDTVATPDAVTDALSTADASPDSQATPDAPAGNPQ